MNVTQGAELGPLNMNKATSNNKSTVGSRAFRSIAMLISDIKWFVGSLFKKKDLILELSKRELKTKYTGSYLGPAWLFLEPICFIGILWFVFTIGFRGGGTVGDVPFIVFLSTGIVCWGYFSENFSANTGFILALFSA